MATAPLPPEPSQDFQERLSPITQAYLANALVDMAFGEANHGAIHAHFATLPERILVFLEEAPHHVHESAREAMLRWNEALAIPLFVETRYKSEAHLNILFLQKLQGNRPIAGRATWRRSVSGQKGGVSITGTIEVALQKPRGGSMSPADITRVLLHELGHILGLKDQKDPEEVMGPVRADGQCTPITERELRALRELQLRSQRILTSKSSMPQTPRIFRF